MLISSPESVVPLDQIQTQLKRILASKLFSRSQRQSAFLAHIVNAACENQSHKLKEFTLGVEVFDKDESFDPGTDSIVRVEASRLRAKLREYYLEQGIDDPIKIEVPKGHYGPVFYHVAGDETTQRGVSESAPSVVPKAFQLLLGGISTAILAGILFLVYESFQKRSTPAALIPAGSVPIASTAWSSRIAVMPLQDLSKPAELHFGEVMTDGLISVLSAADDLRVTSLTSVLKYKNTNVPIASIGRSLGVDHIVDGSLYREDERVRVTAQLFDLKAGEAIWSNTFDRPIESLASLHQEIGAAISALISNAEPPANTHLRKNPIRQPMRLI